MEMEKRKRGFNYLFKTQLNGLKNSGVPENLLDVLIAKRSRLLGQLMSLPEPSGEGFVPFVPVLPINGPGALLPLLSYYKISVSSDFRYSLVANEIEAPLAPYFLINVNKNLECPAGCKIAERSPLLTAEVMALHFHCHNLLKDHHLNAVGSKYYNPANKDSYDVVNLYFDAFQGILRPCPVYVPGAGGSPSCAERL